MANILNIDGMKIIQTHEYVEVNGEKIFLPDWVKSNTKQTMLVRNNIITINGYTLDLKSKTFNKKKNWLYDLFKRFF